MSDYTDEELERLTRPLGAEPAELPARMGALAPYVKSRDMTVTADMALQSCPTSLDITDKKQRAIMFQCGNPGDIVFDTHGIARVKAVHWLIMPDEGEDPETGEIRQFGRLVLIQADGRFFRTTSAFAPRRLRAALELYSPSEWAEGITFTISRRQSARGRTYHHFAIEEAQ